MKLYGGFVLLVAVLCTLIRVSKATPTDFEGWVAARTEVDALIEANPPKSLVRRTGQTVVVYPKN